MTKRQIKICKSVKKHKNLNIVLRKCKLSDYIEIQDVVGADNLGFSDFDMNDRTCVWLTNKALEELEAYDTYMNETRFNRALAIIAACISIISLLKP